MLMIGATGGGGAAGSGATGTFTSDVVLSSGLTVTSSVRFSGTLSVVSTFTLGSALVMPYVSVAISVLAGSITVPLNLDGFVVVTISGNKWGLFAAALSATA